MRPYQRAKAALRQFAWVGSAAGAMHLCYLYTYTNIPTQGQAIPRHPLAPSTAAPWINLFAALHNFSLANSCPDETDETFLCDMTGQLM